MAKRIEEFLQLAGSELKSAMPYLAVSGLSCAAAAVLSNLPGTLSSWFFYGIAGLACIFIVDALIAWSFQKLTHDSSPFNWLGTFFD